MARPEVISFLFFSPKTDHPQRLVNSRLNYRQIILQMLQMVLAWPHYHTRNGGAGWRASCRIAVSFAYMQAATRFLALPRSRTECPRSLYLIASPLKDDLHSDDPLDTPFKKRQISLFEWLFCLVFQIVPSCPLPAWKPYVKPPIARRIQWILLIPQHTSRAYRKSLQLWGMCSGDAAFA